MFQISELIKLNSEDWIAIVILIIITLLAVVNYMFESRLEKLLYLPFSKSYISFYIKDNPLIISAFNTVFFLVNLLTYSLLTYFIIDHFNIVEIGSNKLLFYFQIIAFISVYFLFKFILTIIINVLLLKVKEMNNFTFYKVSFRNFTSLVLIFLLIVYQYSFIDQGLSMYATLIVFTGVFVYGYVYSAKNFLEKNSNSLLHIILYLCALEIAPFLIYGKYVLSNIL